jgi:hypothetical protein
MSLKTESSQAQYVADCLLMVKNIHRTSLTAMQAGLVEAVNGQLELAGVPKVMRQ